MRDKKDSYTEGPWRIVHTPHYLRMGQRGTPLTIMSPHNTEEIATVWTCCQPTEANARLISAAPAMLEALIMVKNLIEHDILPNGKIPMELMNKAIKQAQGE